MRFAQQGYVCRVVRAAEILQCCVAHRAHRPLRALRALPDCRPVFEQVEDPKSKTFFSEIIASISDCKFTAEGNHIVARDYLTVKVWDIRMENEPVVVIPTHEHLRRKLCDLYENDCIFDKFECCTSGDGKFVMTGSYSNCFNIYDREGRHETCIEVRCRAAVV